MPESSATDTAGHAPPTAYTQAIADAHYDDAVDDPARMRVLEWLIPVLILIGTAWWLSVSINNRVTLGASAPAAATNVQPVDIKPVRISDHFAVPAAPQARPAIARGAGSGRS
ncbi:MAG TPA: hypothetical protein VF265_03730 [Nevskiaceae bacterium]